MLPYFLLGLALFAAVFFLLRWFLVADPRQIRSALVLLLGFLGLILAGAFVFFGRHLTAALMLPALLLLLLHRPLLLRAKAARGPSAGQTSEVATRFLKMTLDHDSGEMAGEVQEGPFEGRALSDLGPQDLLNLWQLCRAEDEASARVLEGYLDRTLGEDWREEAGAGVAPAAGMTREEAFEILGLEPGASDEEIHNAYRELMRRLHPDQGGTDYLAAKINQARDLLLEP